MTDLLRDLARELGRLGSLIGRLREYSMELSEYIQALEYRDGLARWDDDGGGNGGPPIDEFEVYVADLFYETCAPGSAGHPDTAGARE